MKTQPDLKQRGNLARDGDGACRRVSDLGNQFEQRRFTRTIGADNAE